MFKSYGRFQEINELFSIGWFEILFSLCVDCLLGHRRCPTTSDVSVSKKSLFYVINPNNEVNCPGELPRLFQIKNWTGEHRFQNISILS